MSDSIIKHAIIGTGFGAKVHLPVFMSSPGVSVVALSDNGSGNAKSMTPKGVNAYNDWKRMLDIERPDSISVVVPPIAQYEIVMEALHRGINVLCEKPFGINLEQAVNMENVRNSSNIIGAVGFQYRYETGIRRMKTLLDNNTIGSINRIDVSWLTAGRADPKRPWSWQHEIESGGGVINAFGTHVFDLLFWLSNLSATAVSGLSRIMIDSRVDANSVEKKVTAEDSIDAIVELGAAVIANLRVSNCQQDGPGMRITVYGDRGWMEFKHVWPFEPANASLIVHAGSNTNICDLASNISAIENDTRVNTMADLISDFCSAVREKSVPSSLPTFLDAIQVQNAIKFLRDSALSKVGNLD